MFDETENQLSAAERRAFEALAREATPSQDLEDRVVALLRRRGHLPVPIGVARPRIPPTWIAGAAAAALALFVSGVAVGQFLGTQSAVNLVRANSSASAAELAARVEQAGSLYVTALASLARLQDTTGAARDSVSRVALAVLGKAAEEMALLVPDDPLAAAVLRGLNQRSRQQDPAVPFRSVVWY
jgi:hypothetical protein